MLHQHLTGHDDVPLVVPQTPLREPVEFAVIGGSGVYKMPCLSDPVEVSFTTPFGDPSDTITVAGVDGVRCAFLPRHHRHHLLTPGEVNYRANIYALKVLGVKYLLSLSATGSLQPHIQPGHLVLVDQLVDKTFGRRSSFFGLGVAHVDFAEPTCAAFKARALPLLRAGLEPDVVLHEGGTLITMEGPQFSTKAESELHRSQGDLVSMTVATEAKLAREAEMAHVIVSMVTDMDAWSDEPPVDNSVVLARMARHQHNAESVVRAVIKAAASDPPVQSPAHSALSVAIMTARENVPARDLARLQPIIGKYMPVDLDRDASPAPEPAASPNSLTQSP